MKRRWVRLKCFSRISLSALLVDFSFIILECNLMKVLKSISELDYEESSITWRR